MDRYSFKAKRLDNREWIIGTLINDGVTGQMFIHQSGNTVNESEKAGEEGCLQFTAFEINPDTLCQCTGLKDNNGNLIWENDIVKFEFIGHKNIVSYEHGSFGIASEQIIDWEAIASSIMPITGCENALYACENDNYL